MTHAILATIFTALILPGVFLVFIPMMPSLSYMFVLALFFGFLDKFAHLTMTSILILGAIFFLSIVVDYLAGILGAKFSGASKKGMLYGFIGVIVGGIIFFPFGGLIGLFVGVLLAELLGARSNRQALKAATGSVIGSLSGIFINALLALTFLILFIIFNF